MKTMYEMLDILPNATISEIKKAYREKCLQVHPDHGGDTVTFQEVTNAYHVLSDQTLRAEYDHYLDKSHGEKERQDDFQNHSYYERFETTEFHSCWYCIIVGMLRYIFFFTCYVFLFYGLRQLGRYLGVEALGYFAYFYIMFRLIARNSD